jgi:DNA-binding beta-propeller fold protein YncE
VKASFAGSTQGNGNSRVLFGRAFVTGGVSRGVDGGGAPAPWLLLMLALAALLLFAAPASAARNHVFEHAFGEPGSGPGQLTEPGGVAINEASGVVYVVDKGNNRVERFDGETGTFIGQFNGSATPAGAFENLESIAIDNAPGSPSFGDVYLADAGHRVIDKFDAGGTYLGQITGTCPAPGPCLPGEVIPFGEIFPGAAVDSSGAVFVYQGQSLNTTEIDKFSNSLDNEPIESLPVSLEAGFVFPGIAIDSADDLFVNTFFHGVVKLSSTGAVLSQGIGGGERAAGLAANQADDDLYFGRSTEVQVLTPSLTTKASFGPPHLTSSAGITVEATTESVYVSDSTADQVAVFSLEPIAPPLIGSESVTDVSASGATLEAEINPRSLPGEVPTTYKFEYDTVPYAEGEPGHGTSVPVPSAEIAPDFALTRVSTPLEGLAPGTTFHFRIVAENSAGDSQGPDRTFTTQPASASALLPDSRAYELVSPPDKHGVPLEGISGDLGEGGLIQSAADGTALTYIANGSITSAPPGNRSPHESQFLSREKVGAWSTEDITTANEEPAGLIPGATSEYYFFSTDLGRAVVEPQGTTPLSPRTTEPTPYLRLPDGTYEPLVTAANVPPNVHFANGAGSLVTFVGASLDLTHLVLSSPQPLTPDLSAPGRSSLFEWSAGALKLISQLPAGAEVRCGGSAAACVPATELNQASNLGNTSQQVRNAVSADGSRVIFSTEIGSQEHHLYMRSVTSGETLQLDAVQTGSGSAQHAPVYQGASSDGSRVLFTDREPLAADSTSGNDLYMCQIEEDAGGLACNLTDITANPLHPSEPAEVQGVMIGAAADGSSVYFVAQGQLTQGEGAVQGDCASNPSLNVGSGFCNLYRYDVSSASLHLLAVLSGADFHNWGSRTTTNLSEITARVSPDGNWLAFMSELPLTGYDNRDAASGERDEEVFLYDVAARGGEGQLVCASCNPSGARPRGVEKPETLPFPLYDSTQNWGKRWIAATIPGWTRVDLAHALYQSRYLSNSGRLFFNSIDALSPADSNGAADVYQYEPAQGPGQPASNDCTTADAAYSPVSFGCISLISSGTSGQESVFLDASESGDDVFFLTAARLRPARDEDGAYDVYDARAGGGEPEPVNPVECSGDACQHPAVPPVHPTPGSLTLNGPGNVDECPKGKTRKSGKCVVKKSTKKKHTKNHKLSKQNQHKSQRQANSDRGGQK